MSENGHFWWVGKGTPHQKIAKLLPPKIFLGGGGGGAIPPPTTPRRHLIINISLSRSVMAGYIVPSLTVFLLQELRSQQNRGNQLKNLIRKNHLRNLKSLRPQQFQLHCQEVIRRLLDLGRDRTPCRKLGLSPLNLYYRYQKCQSQQLSRHQLLVVRVRRTSQRQRNHQTRRENQKVRL